MQCTPRKLFELVLSVALAVSSSSVAPAGLCASAANPGQQFVQPSGRSALLDDAGKPLRPNAVAFVGNDVFFLDTLRLWWAPNAAAALTSGKPLRMVSCGPSKPMIGAIPIQEFLTFAYAPQRGSLIVLDKSGDVYEFALGEKNWKVLRPNSPMGSPDPEYLDLAVSGKNVCLLDPERNQIWRFPATSRKYFKDVLPWRIRPGDISVANGVGIAYDSGTAWVLRSNGSISRYSADPERGMAAQMPFHSNVLRNMRPSRLYTAVGTPLFIVERENNRVVAVDKKNGSARQYLFPGGSDLRGLAPGVDGFWIVNGDQLVYRGLSSADAPNAVPQPRQIDSRLAGLVMPIHGAHLPRHPGVWAGARRLYRFGVHHGTDFFDDPGNGTHVQMDTPVHAADTGKVVRADNGFRDMDSGKYSYVIYQCQRQHISSESNEDLLRGCQVWIDHGNGLVTRYAHLDKVKPGLKPGMHVNSGDLIGYVGVSGTGENLPGRSKHPHLHFEVFLDGKYVGYGLTPSETIGVYEDIFGGRPHSHP